MGMSYSVIDGLVVITGRPARSATMPVLFLLQKWVIRPAGATRCPDKREIWQARGADRRSRSAPPVPNFTFIGAKMWEYSPHSCQKFEFWQ